MWGSVLVAAAEWGTPPWLIAGGSPVVWFFRWVEYSNAREKAIKAQAAQTAQT